MKNNFLGGMKDGESWGLRKWLSRHGGALHICNDLECILRSCQALERSLESTRKIAGRIRPMAEQALKRLKSDVPSSYQEVSSAHPYLPFFHRLESALKGMSNFDPDDDDVICIDDDDEIEDMKHKAQPKKPQKKRKADSGRGSSKRSRAASPPGIPPVKTNNTEKARQNKSQDDGDDDDDDDDSIIEIFDVVKPSARGITGGYGGNGAATLPSAAAAAPGGGMADGGGIGHDWECSACSIPNSGDLTACILCGRPQHGTTEAGIFCSDDGSVKSLSDLHHLDGAASVSDIWDHPSHGGGSKSPTPKSDIPAALFSHIAGVGEMTQQEMAQAMELLASMAQNNQHLIFKPNLPCDTFWDQGPNYASALRLLVTLLRHRDVQAFVDPVDEQQLVLLGRPAYSSVIKHPVCLRDIVKSLCAPDEDGSAQFNGNGVLQRLEKWNMWKGIDLLQALDLVFVNNLAYHGKESSKERTKTQKLRRVLWEGINSITAPHLVNADPERRKQLRPTRRGESSGFVVHK